jgi:hypothetical protein
VNIGPELINIREGPLMSNEMIALLWTIGVSLAMVAWVPFLELIKFLACRHFTPKIGRSGSSVKIRLET